jgi:hypothetical protein
MQGQELIDCQLEPFDVVVQIHLHWIELHWRWRIRIYKGNVRHDSIGTRILLGEALWNTPDLRAHFPHQREPVVLTADFREIWPSRSNQGKIYGKQGSDKGVDAG